MLKVYGYQIDNALEFVFKKIKKLIINYVRLPNKYLRFVFF